MVSSASSVCMHCLRAMQGAADCPHCGAVGGRTAWTQPGLKPGTILHNTYRVGRVLGRGGFAVTYLGAQMNLGNRVAIKEYFPADLSDRDPQTSQVLPRHTGGASSLYREHFRRGLGRFIEEGRNIVRCHEPSPHPNLVRVTDYFEENCTAYLVMDYVDGISLEEHLRQQPGGRLDEKAAVQLMMPVLDGLRAVHDRGFYHRDVKPANIYLSHDGPVILLDFGSARLQLRDETHTMTIMLTPGYAAPEQYSTRGNQGAWTDVYGCAATLYRCLTGEEPVSAMDRTAGMSLAPPSEVLGCNCTRKIESVVLWGLALDCARRPQTVEAFQQALASTGEDRERPLETQPQQDEAPQKEGKFAVSPGLLSVVALVLFSVFGGAYYFHQANSRSSPPSEASPVGTGDRGAAPEPTDTASPAESPVAAPPRISEDAAQAQLAENIKEASRAAEAARRAAVLADARTKAKTVFDDAQSEYDQATQLESQGRLEEAARKYRAAETAFLSAQSRAAATPEAGEIRRFAGREFAWIPAGSFWMGARMSVDQVHETYGGQEDWKQFYEREHPRHKVTLTQGFWMARTLVSVRDFERFVADTNYKTEVEQVGSGAVYDYESGRWVPRRGASWRNPGWTPRPDEPVVLVTWNDAHAYCRWLSATTGDTYRLPTEAEWEYACRAGTTTEFWWGDRAADGRGKINAADQTPLPTGIRWDHAFPFNDGYLEVSPVTAFEPNPWQLHDMLGNVWEWCQDWYAAYTAGDKTDPTGPRSGTERVTRGGSRLNSPAHCRCASRRRDPPDHTNTNRGFRVVRIP